MRTGTRCTTLIQFPVAFCAGSSANAEPVLSTRAFDIDRGEIRARIAQIIDENMGEAPEQAAP